MYMYMYMYNYTLSLSLFLPPSLPPSFSLSLSLFLSPSLSIPSGGEIPHIDGSLRLVNSTPDHTPQMDTNHTLQTDTNHTLQTDTNHTHLPSDGRLEVSYHGIWMAVCGSLFSRSTADVACRQLGFGLAENFCTDSW